nr:sensor histidine kinase [Kibdelosporangium sp. MJ126-NF4]CTQ90213.1 sensor histidine kinase [Kibdelosporangium sp. MJ126-NF4]
MGFDETLPTQRAGLLTKRSLVIASHAVERAALTGIGQAPMIVIAMFQRLPYFERERRVYARIAAQASVTVVGMVDTTRPDLPAGVTPVLLGKDEDLAREWSVVVLSPRFGASVIAQDLEEIDPESAALEAGRLFHGRWGLRRDEAYAETVRMRDVLGDRLPPSVRRRIDEILASTNEPPSIEIEQRTEAAVGDLVQRLTGQRAKAARVAQERDQAEGVHNDPETGLNTLAGLTSWLGTSTDTVPLGVVMVRIAAMAHLTERHGTRASIHTGQNVADLLRSELRPVDRAARISTTDFLLIKPAVSIDMLEATTTRVCERIKELERDYPFVELDCLSTSMLTRRRPLPLDPMRSQLDLAVNEYEWPPVTGDLADLPGWPLHQHQHSNWFS